MLAWAVTSFKAVCSIPISIQPAIDIRKLSLKSLALTFLYFLFDKFITNLLIHGHITITMHNGVRMRGCGHKTSAGQAWTRMAIIGSLAMQREKDMVLQMQVEKKDTTSRNLTKP